MPDFIPTESREDAEKVLLNYSLSPESVRKFSLRPRCCDWCDKRGLKANPLVRFLVRTKGIYFEKGPDTFHWWVHKECAEMIAQDEDVAAWRYL